MSGLDQITADERQHLVQFYDDDSFLVDTVSGFISVGLESGSGAVVVATRPHRDGIEDRLRARGVDLVTVRERGQYVAVDARETLSRFMDGGLPDEKRFIDVVGGLIAGAGTGRPTPVRVFGEMVALLWADRNLKAALRLESLWNQLSRQRRFSLLCAYPMRGFATAADTKPFGDICSEHSGVNPAESYVRATPEERLRLIAHLQQQAAALEAARAELAERLDHERAARAAAEERQVAISRLAAIVEGSDDAIVSKTLDGIITSWNRGAERIFGYTADEAIGQPITLIIPRERRHEEDEVLSRVRRGESLVHFETVRVGKDGSRIDISLTVSPVRDHRDRIVGASKIARDITERRRVERERAQILTLAEQARAEAESANRSKDEFLATLSHELRTPLNAVVGWLAMLRAGTLDRKTSERALEVIERNTHNLSRLVTDLLDVSQIVTGKMTLGLGSVNLVQVVANAIDALRPAAAAKRIAIVPVVDHTVRVMLGDAARLQQAVGNLLSNAVKFTPEAGRIEMRLTALPDGARLTVTDSGRGIAPDFLPYVFDRFRQGDSGAGRAHAGLGLGLAICRHIVELHGGTVRAENVEHGNGARFIVDLPSGLPSDHLALPPAPGPSSAVSLPGSALRGLRVLIVDDDPDTCELLSAVLAGQGAETSAATSAREALDLLEQASPDLVVCDIAMPGTDGYDLIAGIRSRVGDGHPGVAAIALTAYARPEDRDRALRAGFDRHITKPIEPADFVRVVRGLAAAGRHAGLPSS
jgi:PAS domain S-box-containing protein